MLQARSPRRPVLLAATTTVLAVTLGVVGPVAGFPYGADSAHAAAVAAASAPIAFPKGSEVTEAGLTGFMSRPKGGTEKRWTRYSDGSSQGYGARTVLRSSRTADYLVTTGDSRVTSQNLSTTASFDVLVGPTGGATYRGAAGNAVFTGTGAGTDLRMHRHATEGGTVAVTGLPAGASAVAVSPGTPEDALVTFDDGAVAKWGLVDLATGTVGGIRPRTAGSPGGTMAVSDTRVAWTEKVGTDDPSLLLLDRSAGTVEEVPLAKTWASGLRFGLVGGWVVYGEAGGISNGDSDPLYALTAYDPATKAKVKLLDHLTSLAAAPDGLYARGGTIGLGEGLYKLAPGAAGAAPVVTMVASTGEPTRVVIEGNSIPAVVDLDENGGKADLTWQLSRHSVEVKVTLRHVRTGKTREFGVAHPYSPTVTFAWDGTIGADFTSAYNGAYTWEMTAAPINGIGPSTSASGTFQVSRRTVPHDFDDNGSPDVIDRDSAGRLWLSDTAYYKEFGQLTAQSRRLVGAGWNVYDRIEATGNVGGTAVGDLVARDKAGVLWLYQGNGRGGFAARTKVGVGWQIYDRIAAGSDLNGDGRPDLLATDKAGVLWYYKGTGSAAAPFAARTKIGGGWQIFNELTAVGNVAGGPAGDLLARDKAGVLWLYLGKGDGTFTAPTRIGAGWGQYEHLVAIGDGDRDGRPDLVALGPSGGYLYGGTGAWRAPLRARQSASLPYAGDAGHHVA
ncbi:FG-GAP repeat domain-containing protein [Streptomyces sp. NBC_01264]|uniref:FG-GAP repeat domain-containing protein n=1 Tax=Streptomyces sp. NBC_01264 TaxID=2903804 RepID=UPI002251F0FF|nr:VCBS repeat-containing protein [Streptomyces sp. NBC_01264]MCX4781843.1 VCBS repeat-containing protein [Streptomyces sp. NBC_01264]